MTVIEVARDDRERSSSPWGLGAVLAPRAPPGDHPHFRRRGGPGMQPWAGYKEMLQGAVLLKEIAAGQPFMTVQNTSPSSARGCRASSPSGLGAEIQEGAQVQTPYPGLTSMSPLLLWGRSWGRNSLPLLKMLGKMLTAHLQNSIKALSSVR